MASILRHLNRRGRAPSALVLALVLAVACAPAQPVEPILSCDPIGAATPVCGFHHPEDLAALPGGRHVLVSEYVLGEPDAVGRLSSFDLQTHERRILFEAGTPAGSGPWGAADCIGPPAVLSPHGIDLARCSDGALQLLVVQHGARDSIEMFEVSPGEQGEWSLAWRGCATPPGGHLLNDVVARPGGGFLVTRMMATGVLGPAAIVAATMLPIDTGYVLAWDQETSFAEVPGTGGALPNGLAISPDGATLFLNKTLDDEVARIDLPSGRVEARAEVPMPDNATWTSDGRLLVASLRGASGELGSCPPTAPGSCPLPFAIVALDPATMATEVLYEGGPGTPSGAGTVGLEIDGDLLVGSYASDRIVRVDLDQARPH